MKRLYLVLLSLMLLPFIAYAAPVHNSLHVAAQFFYSNGTLEKDVMEYTFNITPNSDCSGVLYTNTTTLNTTLNGVASTYLNNITLSFNTQYYLCVYKNGTLRDSSKLARTPYSFISKNATLTKSQVGDYAMNYSQVKLSDFTNDVGYYDSESDLTNLLNNNYCALGGYGQVKIHANNITNGTKTHSFISDFNLTVNKTMLAAYPYLDTDNRNDLSAHEHNATQVYMNSAFDLLDWYTSTQSAGRLSGGQITDNGDGSVSVANGRGLIHIESGTPSDGEVCAFGSCAQISNLSYITWSTDSSVTLTDNAYNYIYYDGSAGDIKSTTNFYSIDFTQDFTVGRVYRSGTDVTVRLCGTNIWNFNRRVQLFGEEVFPIVRAKGMLTSEETGLKFSITSGVLWAELVNRFETDAFDSSDTGTFTVWYRNGTGGWKTVLSQTRLSNVSYDDGDGTLATIGTNRYGVHWIYMVHDSTVHVVYGQGSYTLSQAQTVSPPSTLPGLLNAYSTLIAKVIILRNANTFNSIQYPWTTSFVGTEATDHGGLAGLTDDDHPQYLLADGTRNLTANWNVRGNNISASWFNGKVNASNVQNAPWQTGTELSNTTRQMQKAVNITGNYQFSTTGTAVATSDSAWTSHNSYPAACSAGQYMTQIGDTVTCSTPSPQNPFNQALNKSSNVLFSSLKTGTNTTIIDEFQGEGNWGRIVSGTFFEGVFTDSFNFTAETQKLIIGDANEIVLDGETGIIFASKINLTNVTTTRSVTCNAARTVCYKTYVDAGGSLITELE